MKTLLLDRTAWDLCIDAKGNIALAFDPYAIVQDVASACRLFKGELYYGPSTRGVPFVTDGLGVSFPTQLFREKLVELALAVPGVASAKVYLARGENRTITGQIQITTTSGVTATVAL